MADQLRNESVRLGIRGLPEPRVQSSPGVALFTGFFFCFHIVKALMSILALLAILCVCENPDCLQLLTSATSRQEYQISRIQISLYS